MTFSKISVTVDPKHPLQKTQTAQEIMTKVEESKQLSENTKGYKGMINPEISFDLLRKTVRSSSLLSGIIKKIAASCDTGFLETSNEDLNKILNKLDVNEGVFNFCTFGNFFYEILTTNGNKIIELDPILTETCLIAEDTDGEEKLIQKGSGNEEVEWGKGEFIHIKRASLTSKYYGDTIFVDCIESILILYFIEQVYRKLFENGFIEPTLLVDEDNVMTPQDKAAITTFIKDYFRGVNNGLEMGIVSGKLKKLDIASKIDHNSFIALKKEIKEDIAIALQIPFDLLSGKNSNRATRESSLEDFNLTTIKPTQARFVRQLKEGLREYFPDAVDEIEMNPVDTKNQKEEAEVVDKLIRTGVFSIDEGREYIGYEITGAADNMIHKVYGSGNSDKTPEEDAVEEVLQKMYEKKGKK
ncbi:phage portal protein [Candidatus Gracilibacteria bacterium]|nr:phage portal protein [Candidatus Gracilibacteria bacterium]